MTMINLSPSPSPSPSPENYLPSVSSPSKLPIEFTPPLIAMVVIIATAFITITYSRVIYRLFRRWRRWRRRHILRPYVPSSHGDIESPPYNDPDVFQIFSPYGLTDSAIKTIPLTIYTRKSRISFYECAVCLLEFEENDYVRSLPVCSHAFHVDCIDIWLKSHANCPLCRTGIFKPDSPFIPVMAARIRPSFDDIVMESVILEAQPEIEEITENLNLNSNSPSRNRRDFLLKRSYSFGFERNLGPATASPWRDRRGSSTSFWTSLTKPRVFSFRHYRGIKSPFFRRRNSNFPLSESNARYPVAGSSRRSKSFASPMFIRSSGMFSSSRLRSGDPEALLSPERFNQR